jgi:GntR family transcriptional regulator
MSIERSPSEYRQVADIVRDRIRTGFYTPGTVLPKEDDLAAQLKVSRTVVNKALAMLRSEGLVRSQRGRGTTVNPIPVIRRNAAARQSKQARENANARGAFDAEVRKLGMTPRVEVTIDRLPAPAAIADTFGIDEHALVLVRSRVMFADDVAVQLATSYIPLEIAEGTQLTEEDTGPGGTYSRLADLGYEPRKFSELTQIRVPDSNEAGALDMDTAQRVNVITRIARTAEGRAVEITESILPAHQWEFYVEWDAE